MIIAVSGPPCSGKSMLSSSVATSLGIPHISSGGLIRDLAARGDPQGGELYARVRDGTLAPSKAIIDLVRHRTSQPDCADGFIIDGFPRLAVEALCLVEDLGPLDLYLILSASDDETGRRATRRNRHDDENHRYRLDLYHAQRAAVSDVIEAAAVPILSIDSTLDLETQTEYVTQWTPASPRGELLHDGPALTPRP